MVIGFLYFLHICAYTIGGNIYDILRFRRESLRPQRAKVKKYRPMVSILIPAYNEELVIERCLESVIRSKYRKIETFVVSDHSKDKTEHLVRRFIADHPEHNIRLITRRQNQGKAKALNYVLQNYELGELVMTLDADSLLTPTTVGNAVAYFVDDSVVGVAANVRIIEDPSVLNLLQLFEYMVAYRTKKFYSVAKAEFIIGGVGSVYRYDTIKEFGYYDALSVTEDIGLSMKIMAADSKNIRLVYGSDVIAYTESVQDVRGLFRQRYRWKYGMLQNLFNYSRTYFRSFRHQSPAILLYRLPMAYLSEFLLILEPLFMTYILYLSIITRSPLIFASAYLTMVLYCSIVLWSDEHLTNFQKRYLTVYVPVLYFLFYIMSFIQVAAIFRCIIAAPRLLSDSTEQNSWLSPRRSGKLLAAAWSKA